MTYIDRHIHTNYPPDVSLTWMVVISFVFHGLLFLAVLGLSTLTFGRGPYVPTIYEVELVSMSVNPLSKPPESKPVSVPSAPEFVAAPPVVEPSEPAIILPDQTTEKKRLENKMITRKREQEEVKKVIPKKKVEIKKKSPPPVKKEVSSPEKKPEPSSETEDKLKEIRNRLLAAQTEKPDDRAKQPPKDDEDIQIIGGPSGGSLLGRAHFGAVANLRMKMYLNQVRDRIESVLVWPSSLEKEKDWITRISIRIAREGEIEKFQIEEKSGNSFFDDAVMRAIKKADPLPPLPDTYRENSLEILCAFHSEKGH